MSLTGSPPLHGGQSVQTNPTPSLAAPFEPVPTSEPRISEKGTPAAEGDDKKKKKRGIFGFGKAKVADDESKNSSSKGPPPPPEKDRPSRKTTASPIMLPPSSPGRAASPRIASPAGSQIFERDVQDSTSVAGLPTSPAIPAHITTENHIPPVLDASSEAITDDHLDPDSVEIITHTGHQPAAVTVTGAPGGGTGGGGASSLGGASTPYDAMSASWADELASSFALAHPGDAADSASNYGSFDTTDVRRLSFISFADVVQGEQQQHHASAAAGSRDSMHLAGLTSLSTAGLAHNRSPSPIRSPVSSQGAAPGTSPPTSKSGSVHGLELSPARKPLGSPPLSGPGPTVSGEIAIETMSQALRRTGSGDLSGVRSLPTSPIEGPSR